MNQVGTKFNNHPHRRSQRETVLMSACRRYIGIASVEFLPFYMNLANAYQESVRL